MQFLGFEIKRKENKKLETFAPREEQDGATIVTAGASYGTYVDVNENSKTEATLIQKYRDMAMNPEVDSAIDEIVNEFVDIEDEDIITLNVSDNVDDTVKETVIAEFDEALRLLDFKNSCYDIVRRWYIDGRIRYHAIIDKTKPIDGIQEVRYIDPRKLRKIKEISTKPAETTNDQPIKVVNEYFIYSERGFNANNNTNVYSGTQGVQGIRIAKDAIVDVPSGLMDTNNQTVLSYLNKAIKPLNSLKTLEDASVIYTLARAPERRVWYIDVGDLPPAKAEQHFNKMVQLHKNKLVYDAATGEVKDDRKYMTMLEDYWLPRRGGNQDGTQVTTLPGGANMNQMTQVEYFQKNLYKALNVPAGRLQEGDTFALGRSTQITRDEVKFSKFIARLRLKFHYLFLQIMERNLLLKNLIQPDDWPVIRAELTFKWASSNYFEELKEGEVLMDRINMMMAAAPLIGISMSQEWADKNILRQSEEEREEMQKQIAEENVSKQMTDNINMINQPDAMPAETVPKDKKTETPDNEGRTSKEDKIHYAKQVVDSLKNKKDKTPEDEKNYQSAVQILSKNKR